MNLYDEFFNIIHEFENHDITYAVVGGIALAFHDKPRFTRDIDSCQNFSLRKSDHFTGKNWGFLSQQIHIIF